MAGAREGSKKQGQGAAPYPPAAEERGQSDGYLDAEGTVSRWKAYRGNERDQSRWRGLTIAILRSWRASAS